MNYNEFWDNVLKQKEWDEELKRWEYNHSHQPFKEDNDSQRRLNHSRSHQ